MAILSKGCKNFEPHNSLKLSFTNISDLRSNFAECEFFFESNSPDILALCEAKFDDSINSGNYSVRVISLSSKKILLLICMVLQLMGKKDFHLHGNNL